MENEKLIEKIYEKRQEIFNKIQLNEFVDKKSFAYWMRINPTMAEIEMKKILDEIGGQGVCIFFVCLFVFPAVFRVQDAIVDVVDVFRNIEVERFDKSRFAVNEFVVKDCGDDGSGVFQ